MHVTVGWIWRLTFRGLAVAGADMTSVTRKLVLEASAASACLHRLASAWVLGLTELLTAAAAAQQREPTTCSRQKRTQRNNITMSHRGGGDYRGSGYGGDRRGGGGGDRYSDDHSRGRERERYGSGSGGGGGGYQRDRSRDGRRDGGGVMVEEAGVVEVSRVAAEAEAAGEEDAEEVTVTPPHVRHPTNPTKC